MREYYFVLVMRWDDGRRAYYRRGSHHQAEGGTLEQAAHFDADSMQVKRDEINGAFLNVTCFAEKIFV